MNKDQLNPIEFRLLVYGIESYITTESLNFQQPMHTK